MATDQRNLPAYFSSNTDFQNWVAGIHAQLAAVGMVQTSDTGQINPATVSAPGGTSTAAGYEIWRFNDTAQATYPIYFKIEYGNDGATQYPSIWLTVGSGSNGSGTITGIGVSRFQMQANHGSPSGTTLPSYASGDSSYVAVLNNADPANTSNPMSFFIDRIRDATGTPTGEGYIVLGSFYSGTGMIPGLWGMVNGVSYAVPSQGYTYPQSLFIGPTAGVTGSGNGGVGAGARVIGSNVAVMPLIVLAGQLRYLKAGVIYSQLDFGAAVGATFTVNNFGAAHTYLVAPRNMQTVAYNGNDSLAILWE